MKRKLLFLKLFSLGFKIVFFYLLWKGDIGISFAAADAALSAPFSSRGESISCVEKILLEGNTNKLMKSYA